ncbi:MAG: UvrD-helicase domain-containing protein [Candidatus Kapaibacteriota bacterium]
MKQKLSKEQIDALNLDIHIALNANAGSGKTSVLVERYLKILERGLLIDKELAPDNVVAITFTKKAAAEMLSRVISRFSERYSLENLENNGTERLDMNFIERLRLFRNKLTNARISTIHSFCLQIISNYPIEAAIPVNFREVSESERLQLLEDAFNQTLMDWLEAPERKKQIGEILSLISFNDLKELAFKAISNIDIWNDLNKLYSKDYQEYLSIFEKYVRTTYQICFNYISLSISSCFQDYDKFNLSSEKVAILKDFFSKSEIFKNDDYSRILFDGEFWQLFNEFIDTIFTQKLKPRKREITDQEIYERLKDISSRYKPIFDFLLKIIEYHTVRIQIKYDFGELDFDVEQQYFETSKTIFSFIKDVSALFQKLKYDEGFVDFSDMLIKTRDLLKNFPEILEELRKEIKYLLVDEFQDTDQIQFEILKLLVPSYSLDETPVPNLFIVGDEKQSIYSFRNADVRVFKSAKEYIEELNNGASERSGLLKLTTTFRLRPEIAGFVDVVFSDLMEYDDGDPLSDFNIDYEPFVIPVERLKQVETQNNLDIAPINFLLEIKGKESNKKKKEIYKDFVLNEIQFGDENESSTNDMTVDEDFEFSTLPILIAKHIKYLVNNENAFIFDRKEDCYRKVRFSDIAVISRKIKDLASLAKTFGDFGIPFIFFGSRNFFSTREIQDVISFLKLLINPRDDVSLAAVLRSMFFAFSDEMLTNIATISSNKDDSYWDKLLIYKSFLEQEGKKVFSAQEFEAQYSKVEAAVKIIEILRQQVSILPVNELIHRILIETEWHKKVRAFQNFEQMLANMDELLDYSREYINVGFRTILDFLDDIDYISRQGIPDVDRFGFVASDAIVLLTFHSAKGLEFPVVYVHNIDYRTRRSDQVGISRELGLIFPVEIAMGGEVYRFNTLQSLFASKQLEMEQNAEELRVLYVALTRASDYLIITGQLKENSKKDNGASMSLGTNSNLEKIFNTLKLNISLPNTNFTFSKNFNIKIGEFSDDGDYKIYSKEITIPIRLIFDLFPEELVDNASEQKVVAEESAPKIFLLDKVESKLSKQLFSSTKFNIFAYDPRSYVKSYYLGIHRSLLEVMKSTLQEEFEYNDNLILSSIIGNTVHFCLEKINHWVTSDGIVVEKLFETIDTSLYEQKRNLQLEVQRQIVEQCLNIVQTNLFKENKERILKSEKEYELLFPFEGNYLMAKFDILFQNEDGRYEIWDWKSNNVKNSNEMFKVAESYRLQMETYAFALSTLFPEQELFVAKLLFTRLAKTNAPDNEWTYNFVWTHNDLKEIKNKLSYYIQRINNLDFKSF